MQQIEHASSGAGALLSCTAVLAFAVSACAGAFDGAGVPAADGDCDPGGAFVGVTDAGDRETDGDGGCDGDGDTSGDVALPGRVADTDGDGDGDAVGVAASDVVGVTDRPAVGDTDADVVGETGDALTDDDRTIDGL